MEELLTTEPGPPKGAKPVNGIAKTIAPPAGAKKKEDTVSEPSLNDGSTQAGLDVSQEPGPKGAKPLGKNIVFEEKTPEQLQKEKSIADMQERRAKQTVKSFQEEITGKREYDGLVDETTQKLAAIPPSFNKGVVSAAAALPKGVGILAQKLDQLTGAPEKPIEEYATYQLGDFIDKKAAEVGITTIDQMNAGFGNSTVPMAFGQMFGMLLSGGPTAAAEGLIPQSIAKQTAKTLSSPMAVSGALQASVPEFEAAKQAGKTDEEAFNVFLKNIPGGLTEVLPIANMFGKINKMTGNGIVNAFKSSTAQGLEEGSQEAVQTFLTNKIAQGSYDPKRDLQQGILEGAGTGFLVGFLMPGIMGAMSKMTPEQKSETQSIIENKLKTPVIPEPIVSPAQVVSEARTSVKSADDTQGAENAAEKILEATQSPNATEGQQLTTQTDGQERNGQGRQEGLLTQETGGWKAGDIIPANYPQPERVIKSVDADLSDTMVKVTFEDGTKGAIQKKKPTPVVEEKPVETKQSTPAQAIDKYENDEKFTIDDLVDELESSDDPKIQEAVSKYRADVREGLEVWGGREDSEAREMGFVNEVKKITGEPQQSAPDISTVGTNYQKVNGNWQVKQADGSWADIVTDTPNKTPEQQSTELTQMKDLLSQMEASEPQNLKMSPTEKGRIAKLEPQTERGAVRKFFWDGGKVLWRTQDPKSSIPRKGIAEEGGLSESEKTPIKEYVDDKKGLSIDQVVESIMDQYTDMEGNKRFTDSDAVKTAVIEVLAQSDPKTWYAEQMETEDQEYLLGKPARDEEMSNLSGKIAHLEAEEQGINETNKQLYENERRVDRGGESQSGSQADGQVRGEQKEEEGGREPALLIQQNGNRDKSQQALKELRTLNLTHVPGLGMGQNQAKGTYISTEEQNRYETADKKAIPVTVAITNPYVADESYFDIQRAAIQKRFGKNAIEDLDTAELDLLSTMMTEYFSKENYDSIYFPKTETQEGELIVFDRSKVTIMDDARIEYENAVHASTQTTLQLEFVPDAEFLKTDKPIELSERQKKIRKDLARLNQLIKCR